jgi:prophage regulatory protein
MPQTLQDLRIVRRAEVLHLTGLSRASLYRLITQALFPAPVRLGTNSVGWRESELRDWLESREVVGQSEAADSEQPAPAAPPGGAGSVRSAP